MSYDAWPSDTRRAFARAELKKRGLRMDQPDAALESAFKALREGVATLPDFVSPFGFLDAVEKLRNRIDLNVLTTIDKVVLSSIPNCCLEPEALVKLFSDLNREF